MKIRTNVYPFGDRIDDRPFIVLTETKLITH
jgi:hypothetical protein